MVSDGDDCQEQNNYKPTTPISKDLIENNLIKHTIELLLSSESINSTPWLSRIYQSSKDAWFPLNKLSSQPSFTNVTSGKFYPVTKIAKTLHTSPYLILSDTFDKIQHKQKSIKIFIRDLDKDEDNLIKKLSEKGFVPAKFETIRKNDTNSLYLTFDTDKATSNDQRWANEICTTIKSLTGKIARRKISKEKNVYTMENIIKDILTKYSCNSLQELVKLPDYENYKHLINLIDNIKNQPASSETIQSNSNGYLQGNTLKLSRNKLWRPPSSNGGVVEQSCSGQTTPFYDGTTIVENAYDIQQTQLPDQSSYFDYNNNYFIPQNANNAAAINLVETGKSSSSNNINNIARHLQQPSSEVQQTTADIIPMCVNYNNVEENHIHQSYVPNEAVLSQFNAHDHYSILSEFPQMHNQTPTILHPTNHNLHIIGESQSHHDYNLIPDQIQHPTAATAVPQQVMLLPETPQAAPLVPLIPEPPPLLRHISSESTKNIDTHLNISPSFTIFQPNNTVHNTTTTTGNQNITVTQHPIGNGIASYHHHHPSVVYDTHHHVPPYVHYSHLCYPYPGPVQHTHVFPTPHALQSSYSFLTYSQPSPQHLPIDTPSSIPKNTRGAQKYTSSMKTTVSNKPLNVSISSRVVASEEKKADDHNVEYKKAGYERVEFKLQEESFPTLGDKVRSTNSVGSSSSIVKPTMVDIMKGKEKVKSASDVFYDESKSEEDGKVSMNGEANVMSTPAKSVCRVTPFCRETLDVSEESLTPSSKYDKSLKSSSTEDKQLSEQDSSPSPTEKSEDIKIKVQNNLTRNLDYDSSIIRDSGIETSSDGGTIIKEKIVPDQLIPGTNLPQPVYPETISLSDESTPDEKSSEADNFQVVTGKDERRRQRRQKSSSSANSDHTQTTIIHAYPQNTRRRTSSTKSTKSLTKAGLTVDIVSEHMENGDASDENMQKSPFQIDDVEVIPGFVNVKEVPLPNGKVNPWRTQSISIAEKFRSKIV